MNTMKRPFWLLLVLTPALGGAKCGESLIQDPGFDLWCGERLCRWTVEEGSIARAPTWHERDYGVDLMGPAVLLSQRTEIPEQDRPACIAIDLLSDLDSNAAVVLEVDFDEDGRIELSQVLPTGRWATLAYKTPAPTWYRSAKFSIHKRGTGHATLARIRVGADIGCQGPPPFTPDRPAGAPCETAPQCESGVCVASNDAGVGAPPATSGRCR